MPAGRASPASAERPHRLLRPQTVRGLWIGFAAVLAILAAADLFVQGHAGFGVKGTFGFYAWYGFGTCVVMALAAKGIGLFLKRPDGYYADADEDGDGAPDAPGGSGRGQGGRP